ncbi:hypothetical protein PCANC_12014 [Puccinia coronata f. sp. avenae]|uniref:Uncharacterized protein n=1 Tax=Puccinia coronata f. sp. avenae TaxID=200324 RepID=A0A2N5UUT0_9BASI|nr:hypothetical protein PCANC_12014 [Puccinia coronata f. sp. avenae]
MLQQNQPHPSSSLQARTPLSTSYAQIRDAPTLTSTHQQTPARTDGQALSPNPTTHKTVEMCIHTRTDSEPQNRIRDGLVPLRLRDLLKTCLQPSVLLWSLTLTRARSQQRPEGGRVLGTLHDGSKRHGDSWSSWYPCASSLGRTWLPDRRRYHSPPYVRHRDSAP